LARHFSQIDPVFQSETTTQIFDGAKPLVAKDSCTLGAIGEALQSWVKRVKDGRNSLQIFDLVPK
jgi:hypothetical protein